MCFCSLEQWRSKAPRKYFFCGVQVFPRKVAQAFSKNIHTLISDCTMLLYTFCRLYLFWLQTLLCNQINWVEVKPGLLFGDRSILRPLGGLECEDKSRLEVEGWGARTKMPRQEYSLVSGLETSLSNRSGVTGHWCHHRSLLDSADSNVDP